MKLASILAVAIAFAVAGGASAREQSGWQGSFDASYQAAGAGDTIVVPPGTYPGETIASRNVACCVTFTMGGSVTVNGTLRVEAQNLKIVGGTQLKITYLAIFGATNFMASGIDGAHFDVFETNGPIAITDGDWGPCQAPRDDPSCVSRIGSASNVLVEGNVFHDVTSTDLANYHVDGFAVFGGANNVLRGNRFFRNMITNIRVQTCCGNPQVQNLLIEGNWFAHSVAGDNVSKNANAVDIDSTVPGLQMRFNSLEEGTYFQIAGTQTDAVSIGNLLTRVSCEPGVSYSYTVFMPWSELQGQQACSPTDTKVSSLGYVNGGPDLASTSPAIDAAGNSCPATDLFGAVRPAGVACDAGAVEFSSAPPPPPPPPPPECPAPELGWTAPTRSTITVTWQAVGGATGYRLFKDGVAVSTAGAGATSAKFGNLPYGATLLGVEMICGSVNSDRASLTTVETRTAS